jgi:predicted solute-binding protein
MKVNEMALYKDFGIIKYVKGDDGDRYYLVKHIVSGEVSHGMDIKDAYQTLEKLNTIAAEDRDMVDKLAKRGYKVYKEIRDEITLD